MAVFVGEGSEGDRHALAAPRERLLAPGGLLGEEGRAGAVLGLLHALGGHREAAGEHLGEDDEAGAGKPRSAWTPCQTLEASAQLAGWVICSTTARVTSDGTLASDGRPI